jgi:hypothetical protein
MSDNPSANNSGDAAGTPSPLDLCRQFNVGEEIEKLAADGLIDNPRVKEVTLDFSIPSLSHKELVGGEFETNIYWIEILKEMPDQEQDRFEIWMQYESGEDRVVLTSKDGDEAASWIRERIQELAR